MSAGVSNFDDISRLVISPVDISIFSGDITLKGDIMLNSGDQNTSTQSRKTLKIKLTRELRYLNTGQKPRS